MKGEIKWTGSNDSLSKSKHLGIFFEELFNIATSRRDVRVNTHFTETNNAKLKALKNTSYFDQILIEDRKKQWEYAQETAKNQKTFEFFNQ